MKKSERRGFTLIELLVVIVVILILIGLLVPVINTMRKSAYAARTASTVSNLANAIQQYYQDFHAYPGPLGNDQIFQTLKPAPPAAPSQPFVIYQGNVYHLDDSAAPNMNDVSKITMSENLVLGLLGGVKFLANDPAVGGPAFRYDPAIVGQGPAILNTSAVANVRAHHGAYLEMKTGELTKFLAGQGNGIFQDSEGLADDSNIPEFLDAFPVGMPILYMRARSGANPRQPPQFTDLYNPVVTDDIPSTAAPAYRSGQYDLSQIIAYTGSNIGVGKDSSVKNAYKDPASIGSTVAFPNHGLKTVNPQMTLTTYNGASPGQYPYDLYAYLLHPSIPNTPRQKDAFILISAGKDRIYGTEDDITNFGSVAP